MYILKIIIYNKCNHKLFFKNKYANKYANKYTNI